MKRWIDDPHLRGGEEQAKALLEGVEEPRAMPNARTRVWARLEGPKAKERSLAWVALAGGLAGATVVGLVMIGRPSVDRVTLGEAVAVEVDARPASAGSALADSSVIRVGPSGKARLVGAPLGTIAVAPSSGLTLIGIETGRLALSEGRIDRVDGEPGWLSIDAGSYTVEANGTFWLARLGDEIDLEILSGQAKVAGRGRIVPLSAGARFKSAEASAAIAPEQPAVPIAATTEAVAAEPDAVAPRPQVAAPRPERRHPRAERTERPLVEPVATPITPRAETALEPGAAKTESAETPAIPATRAPALPVALDWGDKYRAAQKERVPEKAIPLFDEIAQGPSAYAEVAGHQAARLVMRRGRCAEAIGRFEALLRRFPSGSYVPEGQLNLVECRLVTGDLGGASRALDQFLATNPGSERTAELVRMRDELARRNKK